MLEILTETVVSSVSVSSFQPPSSIMAAAVRLLPTVTFALLSAFPAAVSSRRDVLELGHADFDYLAAEHETMLVKFYAPW